MTEITSSSAAVLAGLISSKEASSVEITTAFLDRLEKLNPKTNSYLYFNRENSLAQAKRADQQLAEGKTVSPLHGVPIAVKDNLTTTDAPTTAGSKILEGWVPQYDATVVRKLREASMPILGKTNLDEFAMGSSTEFSAYGPSKNPWDLTRIPGGSGGGSSSAIAGHLAPLAIGSDTGGSIRFPAAMTGSVGAKPTYGAVSRYGLIALASSLDQIGPVTNSVMDAALLQDVIGGHDPNDSTSLPNSLGSMVQSVKEADVKGLRVGVVKQLSSDGFQPGVKACFDDTIKKLAAAGAEIIEVDCPSFEYAVAAYYLILPAEASSNLAKFDSVRFGLRVTPDGNPTIENVMAATREQGFGPEVKRRIILGTYALSSGYYDAYYGSAQKVRTLIQQDLAKAFTQADVLLTPTAPTTAFKIGEKVNDPLAMYLNDIATIPANLAGIPGISVPNGLASEDGLPSGVQILAPAMQDGRMYRVASIVEKLYVDQWGASLIARVPDLEAL
ncbi:aspartyl/glutamyl-tRNA(Asn/Gln) amidotransferase subunit A [Candidatus Aquiluna sp. IMCC13023]|uniref:Asp-tRNA(Asn)/Glu-tRNA(Gln) amidotransferase subunit GatA n=1 Tax=Candidatus Aquiluna sp. IMCC13023 TaxID=1081644 RepID=UPI00025B2B81|nr:Asp-tRNA(Asn)/Glu-tRNA(Gln) amidotransferase subunit GatA [Candidatus Aquiluna sp. IMCC13023]EIC91561.1 aspartyl/glutamyl-tRNA(Asn/Gln) amidotransferase subunit A [Candidatus Aquiluna sp. IMCC13023]